MMESTIKLEQFPFSKSNSTALESGLTCTQQYLLSSIYLLRQNTYELTNFETLLVGGGLCYKTMYSSDTRFREAFSARENSIRADGRCSVNASPDKIVGMSYQNYIFNSENNPKSMTDKLPEIIQLRRDASPRRAFRHAGLITFLTEHLLDAKHSFGIVGTLKDEKNQNQFGFINMGFFIEDHLVYFTDMPVKVLGDSPDHWKLKNFSFFAISYLENDKIITKRIPVAEIKKITTTLINGTVNKNTMLNLLYDLLKLNMSLDERENNLLYYTYGVKDMEGLYKVA